MNRETSDRKTRDALREMFRAAEGKPPAFDAVWTAAERRHRASLRRRIRVAGSMAAAAAVAAVAVMFSPGQQPDSADEYLIADALMNSTSWTAPSDVLLPDHRFDIYRDIPELAPSTISQEGSLL